MEPILQMRHVTKSFFGVKANDNVDFDLFPGEIHALLGENGAGKTTLMNILYGIYPCDEGEIRWKGEVVRFSSPKEAIDRKIGMVHQHFTLVDKLTVSQNITLGLKCTGYPFTDRNAINLRISQLSASFGLEVDPDAMITSLSVGQQQRVEILKLLYRNAELLVFDEPTAVLAPTETQGFFHVLRQLKKAGKSSIIITHRIPEVMEIADRVTVLRDGKKIATAPISELDEHSLSTLMIGRQLDLVERKPHKMGDDESGLLLDSIGVDGVLDHVSLRVRSGEILGIAGVDGNGQKPLVEAIVGIRKCSEGTIRLAGTRLDGMDVRSRKSLGIGYISDDRHRDGLVMDMGLGENMLLRSDYQQFVRHGFIDKQALQSATRKAIDQFAIKTCSTTEAVRLLSGGNQQKLILAREIHQGVRLIVAFQPTRGLDIGASESIRQLLLRYRDAGCAVLLVSADLEEILSISDRIAVIHSGRIIGEVANSSGVDMTRIGLMMAGKQTGECQ